MNIRHLSKGFIVRLLSGKEVELLDQPNHSKKRQFQRLVSLDGQEVLVNIDNFISYRWGDEWRLLDPIKRRKRVAPGTPTIGTPEEEGLLTELNNAAGLPL